MKEREGKQKAEDIAVLFVICCRNYQSPAGIRMNNEAYTSYPSEKEVLLCEGCELYVSGIERNVLICNPDP